VRTSGRARACRSAGLSAITRRAGEVIVPISQAWSIGWNALWRTRNGRTRSHRVEEPAARAAAQSCGRARCHPSARARAQMERRRSPEVGRPRADPVLDHIGRVDLPAQTVAVVTAALGEGPIVEAGSVVGRSTAALRGVWRRSQISLRAGSRSTGTHRVVVYGETEVFESALGPWAHVSKRVPPVDDHRPGPIEDGRRRGSATSTANAARQVGAPGRTRPGAAPRRVGHRPRRAGRGRHARSRGASWTTFWGPRTADHLPPDHRAGATPAPHLNWLLL